jgi:hypothetical protein
MILASHGIIASSISQGVVPLLDIYGSAAAAYSLRKLRTTYSGSAIRVRRTDLAESDIGFTSTGALDTTSLLAFTGTGALDNGFITTWYDQSGNGRNALQSTAIRQPQLVSAGAVLLQGGKPTIAHVGTTDLKITTFLDMGTTYAMLGVIKFNAYNREFIGKSGNWSYAIYNTNTTSFDTEARQTVARPSLSLGLDYMLFETYRNGTTTINAYKNTNGATANYGANNNFDFKSLSGEELDAYNFVGNMSEVVIYTSNQSSNRTGIESNINSYYAIY